MKIVVCLHAPPPDVNGTGLGRDDAHALAQGLALASAGQRNDQLTALLAGTAAESGALQRALAAGASRAVRLTGEDFATADFHMVGQALATGIKRLGADLVLAGARSDDEGLGAVPASTARHLGFVCVSGVEELAPAADGGAAVEVVVRGGGKKRRLRVDLPAVLSIVAGPRAAPSPPDRTGNPTDVEVMSLTDPEATVVRRRTEFLGRPEPASRGTEEVTSADAFIAALTRR
jgi:electron transfer flavoprotein alpha/beta subunit